MIYHDYSYFQLEAMADDLNRRYDSSRLKRPKTVDVYDLIDMLGARIAFEYLSPDRTYLGVTLFKPSLLYVWPGNPYKEGMLPTTKMFYGGTIIIDRDLNEGKSEQDHFAENFTVMHECFHFCRHRAEFQHITHLPMSFSSYSKNQSNKKSVLYRIERQANYAAAAFLMPRGAVIYAAKKMLGYRENGQRVSFGYKTKDTIKEMGRQFGTNYSPMAFRLQEIGVLAYDFNPFI